MWTWPWSEFAAQAQADSREKISFIQQVTFVQPARCHGRGPATASRGLDTKDTPIYTGVPTIQPSFHGIPILPDLLSKNLRS